MTALDRAMGALLRRVTEAAILPHYRNLSAGEIEHKGSDDVVTVADRQAEAMLAEGLAAIDPSLAIVGEEAVHADPALADALSGDAWIIDPIDGTNNYAAGKPPFGIIIARSEGGLAQQGWLFDCLSGRLCSARRGSGAFVDGERVTTRATGQTPPIAAISLVFADPTRREAICRHIAPHYTLVDIPRCAAEQYPRLALGTNDVSLFERTLAWDHAAGILWLEEAGGRAARPDGSPYRVDEPERTGLVGAATPALWDKLARRYAAVASS